MGICGVICWAMPIPINPIGTGPGHARAHRQAARDTAVAAALRLDCWGARLRTPSTRGLKFKLILSRQSADKRCGEVSGALRGGRKAVGGRQSGMRGGRRQSRLRRRGDRRAMSRAMAISINIIGTAPNQLHRASPDQELRDGSHELPFMFAVKTADAPQQRGGRGIFWQGRPRHWRYRQFGMIS
jgi:hypothetical protein